MGSRQLFVDEDILLREIGLQDVESIFNTIVDERIYLDEWLPFIEATQDISYTRSFVESYLDSDKLDLTCVILFEKKIVGLIGLKDTDLDNRRTEIGYWLSESFQHKGIVTKSCKVLINYAFSELDLNRIQIKAATGNLKSRAIPERLGFIQEGIERDGELHRRGFVDLVVYALLKNDWVSK